MPRFRTTSFVSLLLAFSLVLDPGLARGSGLPHLPNAPPAIIQTFQEEALVNRAIEGFRVMAAHHYWTLIQQHPRIAAAKQRPDFRERVESTAIVVPVTLGIVLAPYLLEFIPGAFSGLFLPFNLFFILFSSSEAMLALRSYRKTQLVKRAMAFILSAVAVLSIAALWLGAWKMIYVLPLLGMSITHHSDSYRKKGTRELVLQLGHVYVNLKNQGADPWDSLLFRALLKDASKMTRGTAAQAITFGEPAETEERYDFDRHRETALNHSLFLPFGQFWVYSKDDGQYVLGESLYFDSFLMNQRAVAVCLFRNAPPPSLVRDQRMLPFSLRALRVGESPEDPEARIRVEFYESLLLLIDQDFQMNHKLNSLVFPFSPLQYSPPLIDTFFELMLDLIGVFLQQILIARTHDEMKTPLKRIKEFSNLQDSFYAAPWAFVWRLLSETIETDNPVQMAANFRNQARHILKHHFLIPLDGHNPEATRLPRVSEDGSTLQEDEEMTYIWKALLSSILYHSNCRPNSLLSEAA